MSVIKLYLAALVSYNWERRHMILLITPFFLLFIYCWAVFTGLLPSTFVSNMTITPGMRDGTPCWSYSNFYNKGGKFSVTRFNTMLITASEQTEKKQVFILSLCGKNNNSFVFAILCGYMTVLYYGWWLVIWKLFTRPAIRGPLGANLLRGLLFHLSSAWWVLEFRIMFLRLWNCLGFRWDENPFRHQSHIPSQAFRIKDSGVGSCQLSLVVATKLQLRVLSDVPVNHTIFPALDLLLGNYDRIVT